MKKLILMILVLIGFNSIASTEEICSAFLEEAENICMEIICEQTSCDSSDGDLQVIIQSCVWDEGIFDELLTSFNKKHPNYQLNCEDL
jgi:hypothetical protein